MFYSCSPLSLWGCKHRYVLTCLLKWMYGLKYVPPESEATFTFISRRDLLTQRAGGAPGCGHSIAHVCVIAHAPQLPACMNVPDSCGPVVVKAGVDFSGSLSLFSFPHPLSPCTFTLKCPFTSPLPLAAKNLWLLGFDFNHCLLTSPLWTTRPCFPAAGLHILFIFTQRQL